MTRVRFHAAALAELAHEVLYYAQISPQLGERFATVVERAVAIAAEFLDMGSRFSLMRLNYSPISLVSTGDGGGQEYGEVGVGGLRGFICLRISRFPLPVPAFQENQWQ